MHSITETSRETIPKNSTTNCWKCVLPEQTQFRNPPKKKKQQTRLNCQCHQLPQPLIYKTISSPRNPMTYLKVLISFFFTSDTSM